jgi:hypothetical protein
VSSRVKSGHKILKNELGTNRDTLLNVIEKFGNLLRRLYQKICITQEQESIKLISRFRNELFSLIVRKISVYALNLVLT